MSGSEFAPSTAGRRVVRGWLGIALCFVTGVVTAQPTDAHNRDEIRALIARAHLPQLKRPDFTTFRQALDTFYGTDGYAARWFEPDAPWHAGQARRRPGRQMPTLTAKRLFSATEFLETSSETSKPPLASAPGILAVPVYRSKGVAPK